MTKAAWFGWWSATRGSDAETLERRLGVAPVATVPQLRVHVLSVRSDRAEAVLAELRSSPIVLYAQRDTVVTALRTPNDELWPSQWSPRKTRAPQAWSLTTGSARVVVAVADTGVDSNQPDLRGKVVAGYDFVHGDSAATDDNGHGTAVAGVVAASGNNGIGVAGYCWQCRVMPVKVLGADGPGFSSTLAQGIVWATDHGARIVNASLGGPDSDAAVAGATQYAAAHGSLVVAAAGNDSSSVLEYPAALPGVLSVGATDRADHLYGFSNAGAAVAAPGGELDDGARRRVRELPRDLVCHAGRQRHRGALPHRRSGDEPGTARPGARADRRARLRRRLRPSRRLRRLARGGSRPCTAEVDEGAEVPHDSRAAR